MCWITYCNDYNSPTWNVRRPPNDPDFWLGQNIEETEFEEHLVYAQQKAKDCLDPGTAHIK